MHMRYVFSRCMYSCRRCRRRVRYETVVKDPTDTLVDASISCSALGTHAQRSDADACISSAARRRTCTRYTAILGNPPTPLGRLASSLRVVEGSVPEACNRRKNTAAGGTLEGVVCCTATFVDASTWRRLCQGCIRIEVRVGARGEPRLGFGTSRTGAELAEVAAEGGWCR